MGLAMAFDPLDRICCVLPRPADAGGERFRRIVPSISEKEAV
jgi:hypothetical protein